MPVCAVDVVVHRGREVLLLRRKDPPARGQWWLPGGRLRKNETLARAALRKAREETGLTVRVERQIGVYEVRFQEGPFPDLRTGVHNVAVCFLARPARRGAAVRPDGTSSDFRWTGRIERGLHPYVKRILRDSGLF